MEARRVLIVDDESAFTNLVKLHLEKTGRFTVRAINDPTQTLEVAREFRPEVVVLDIIMPGKDGGEVLAELRASEFQHVPALFVTATISQLGLDHQKGQIKGVPFLAKPVNPKKLIGVINELLGK